MNKYQYVAFLVVAVFLNVNNGLPYEAAKQPRENQASLYLSGNYEKTISNVKMFIDYYNFLIKTLKTYLQILINVSKNV